MRCAPPNIHCEGLKTVSSEVNAPVSTSVIAVDLPAAAPAGNEAKTLFERMIVGVGRQLGAVTQEAGDPNVAIALSPEAAVEPALLRVASAIADFEHAVPGSKLRAVVHHGVVFRTVSGGKETYMGSAIRSAQSTLRRVPVDAGFVATSDFTAYMASTGKPPRNFEVRPGLADNMSQLRFPEQRRDDGGLAGSDPALLDFLKTRLAEHIGPFASPLVDNVSHASMTAKEVVAALSHEVSDPKARQRFEMDALAYLKKRIGGGAPASAAAAAAPKESKGLFDRLLKR